MFKTLQVLHDSQKCLCDIFVMTRKHSYSMENGHFACLPLTYVVTG